MLHDIPMIATSAPDYIEESVIDVDFGFTSGVTLIKTLRPEQGDELRRDDRGFLLHMAGPNLTAPEEFVAYYQALAWHSIRHRVRRLRRREPGSTASPASVALADRPAASTGE
jgi:hypothetical protein